MSGKINGKVLFPQVAVWINSGNTEMQLSVPPNYIQSFTYEEKGFAGNSWSLELFDPTFRLLPYVIYPALAEKREYHIKFQFGFPPDRLSPVRYGYITGIDIDINRAGMELSLSGFDVVTSKVRSIDSAIYKGKISDIVRKICKKNGFDCVVEETADIYEPDKRPKDEKKYRKSNMTDLQFINYLAQRARPAKGKGRFYVWIDDTQHPPVLYFTTKMNKEGINRLIYKKYVYQTDKEGEVLSFSVNINGETIAQYTDAVKVKYLDPLTFSCIEEEVNKDTFTGDLSLGSYNLSKQFYTTYIPLSPRTRAEARNFIENLYSAYLISAVEGSMEIVGDPDIHFGNVIEVVIYTPQGEKFFTSGLYFVNSVTHTINGGSYTTELELKRDAMDFGMKRHKRPLLPKNDVTGGL